VEFNKGHGDCIPLCINRSILYSYQTGRPYLLLSLNSFPHRSLCGVNEEFEGYDSQCLGFQRPGGHILLGAQASVAFLLVSGICCYLSRPRLLYSVPAYRNLFI